MPQISPIVQRARSASRIGTSRFASPSAAARTSASAASAASRVALGADARRPLELAALDLRVDALELDLRPPSASVNAFTPTITRSPDSTSLRVAERRLLDLVLDEALLDRGDGAAELLDPVDQLERRAPRSRSSATR